jgi:hypothetical protein
VIGAKNGNFSAFSFCPSTLYPNTNCFVIASFDSSTLGQQSANIQFVDSASNSPQLVGLTAKVVSTVITVTPTSISFGNVKVGTPSTQNVSITNDVSTPLLLGISVSGTDFSQTTNCPIIINPSANCTVFVTFKPSAKKTRTGTLAISTDARNGSQNVPLSGTGD